MKSAFRHLDRILRGDATRLTELKDGHIQIPAAGLAGVLTVLGMFYGACMGLFAVTGSGSGDVRQVIASALKVPMLFLLTLAVTFPSLYVFNALVGSRLRAASLLRLLTAAVAVMMAVLASMGTIIGFFSFSSTSYPFMVLLNVVVFAVSGFLGLTFLLQTLHRLTVVIYEGEKPLERAIGSAPSTTSERLSHIATEPPVGISGNGDLTKPLVTPAATSAATATAPPPPSALQAKKIPAPGALERLEGHLLGSNVKTIFKIWIVVFGLVGAQMAWVLRPFVGDPGKEFQLFRQRHGNFFEDVIQKIGQLFS